jgi:hypothetical protein
MVLTVEFELLVASVEPPRINAAQSRGEPEGLLRGPGVVSESGIDSDVWSMC